MTPDPRELEPAEADPARARPPTPDPDLASPVLRFRPDEATRALVVAGVGLVLLSTAGQVLKFVTGHDTAKGFIPLFHVATEGNVFTYFSALLLLLAALLLGWIGRSASLRGEPFARHWTALAVFFVLLSVDDATAVHERLIVPVRELLGLGGLLYFAWVIPGALLVLAVAAAFFRFFRRLPRDARRHFALGAAFFVGGAIGMELLGGLHYEGHGDQTVTYSVLTTVEESMELAGILVFLRGLFRHAAAHAPFAGVRIDGERAPVNGERAPVRSGRRAGLPGRSG